MDLTGRTALVTGSSRNIGRATAVRLAEAGADVGITARSNEEGCKETARLVRETGSSAAVALADLGDPDAIRRMVEELRETLGPFDILVNNATIRPTKPFEDLEPADIDRVTDVNVRGFLLTTQAVIPDMQRAGGGSVVNLIGTMVYLGKPGHAHSYGTKFGIEGQVRQLATEFGSDGIRVNAISPGLIDVERTRTDEWDRIERSVIEATPLGRLGEPEEIADACCFLASDSSSFLTGQVIHVNGGTYPTANVIPID
ncbi:SDR family NAD(P)-dependent oxidoreductase [Halorubrum vacuolatum]|uniref:3-oxoacyl-[acyl-carrier-protein] reductase n=1 Tax=Halorubrum vacuolatum TaxID=63740 RepID=A0A238WIZ5_HALVU|nr:SDR family NAD(P)-dependent oxidoreductase [Halorubrum vacuolatum]SNR46204.1 3-oxoacyl-[acyl-carrier-protein] reductase [Halorubrum vacuolatum]